MRPNELGGQTLENGFELTAAMEALAVDGHMDVAMYILLNKPPEGVPGNIHPSLLVGNAETVRVLDTEISHIMLKSLDKVARGKRLVAHKESELMAQSMMAAYRGEEFQPKANRGRKAVTHLLRLVS